MMSKDQKAVRLPFLIRLRMALQPMTRVELRSRSECRALWTAAAEIWKAETAGSGAAIRDSARRLHPQNRAERVATASRC